MKLPARFIVVMILAAYTALYAQELKSIKLPAAETEGGKPLMQALKARKSQREYSSRELPLQVLSNLLWAADGINRPETGGRTAPTAMDAQEIDIYVAKQDGLYLYDAAANTLVPVLAQDIRAQTGIQPFVKDAAVNLIFVANASKMGRVGDSNVDFYCATDTGFVSQNVYLYCASVGLATVVRGWVDKPALAKIMKLKGDQRIILAQCVGYPR